MEDPPQSGEGRGWEKDTIPEMGSPLSWKYSYYTELEGIDELYDLNPDPHELKNLLNDKSREKPLGELKAGLARLLSATEGSQAQSRNWIFTPAPFGLEKLSNKVGADEASWDLDGSTGFAQVSACGLNAERSAPSTS